MSKTVSPGYTDTAIEGVSSLNFARGLVNFEKDFKVKMEIAGKEVVLTNITSPVDRPEKVRIAYSEVANVYAGTGIETGLCAPTKKGVSILAQVTETLSVSDSSDPTYRIDLPVSYHLVIKVPVSEHITSSTIITGIGRLLSALFDTGSTGASRLDGLLRGSLVPSDV